MITSERRPLAVAWLRWRPFRPRSSAQRGPRHQTEHRARVGVVVPGDAVQDEALEAGHDRRGGWVT